MIIFRSLLFFALSILVATPVQALSCRPYPPRAAFQDANAASERYIIARGQLDFNPANLPVTDMENQADTPQDTLFNATLTGFSLTAAGFNARFVRQIRVNVQCYGPWCGALNPGQDYLVFLKQDNNGYLLESNPCGGFAFTTPSQETLDDMHQCLLGETCEPPQF